MLKSVCKTALILVGVALGHGSLAADFSDPSWPCVQRKVERLSIGLMWPYALDHDSEPAAAIAEAEKLAERFALRRNDLDALEPALAAFTERHGSDTALLGLVFEESFDRLARQRRAIIAGIEEYSLQQIALSERIDSTRKQMDQLIAAEAPDFDRVDALEEQLHWDERIYTDRQKSLIFVCETPVLLEKRLYAIAQMLAAAS